MLKNELAKEQVVIWFRFTAEILFMHWLLGTKKITNDFISGEVKPAERQRITKRFKKGDLQCLLVQLKCGKFGLNYSNASAALYYSNSFEYEERRQSEDRIVSSEKNEPVLVIDLLVKNSIDEDLYSALQTKEGNTKIFTTRILENFKKRNRSHASTR